MYKSAIKNTSISSKLEHIKAQKIAEKIDVFDTHTHILVFIYIFFIHLCFDMRCASFYGISIVINNIKIKMKCTNKAKKKCKRCKYMKTGDMIKRMFMNMYEEHLGNSKDRWRARIQRKPPFIISHFNV